MSEKKAIAEVLARLLGVTVEQALEYMAKKNLTEEESKELLRKQEERRSK